MISSLEPGSADPAKGDATRVAGHAIPMEPAPARPEGPPPRHDRTGGFVLGRWLLATLGGLFFVIGWIGVFVPGLPTTPFWILAAWSFAKSCPAFGTWIYRQPRVGESVRMVVEDGALGATAKKHALIGAWAGISFAILLAVVLGETAWWFFAALIACGGIATWYVGFHLRTAEPRAALADESGD